MLPSLVIPAALQARHARTRQGRDWVAALPRLVQEALQRWELTLDVPPGAEPWHGHTGLVVPVRGADGAAAALKIAFPTEETLLEPMALALWAGRGMVQLLAHDEASVSWLLARLDADRSLQQLPLEEAITQWGTVLRRLSLPAEQGPGWAQLPHIAATAEQFSDELPQRWEELNRPFPRWLLEAALEVCQTRGSVARRRAHDVLVHTDLHYQNILATLDGGAYVAIDPQAQVGDAEYAVAPCLWNRLPELPRQGAEAALRRRAGQLCAAAGLDESIAVEWAVLREVENALWYLEQPGQVDDAHRSLWVASTLTGSTLPGLPAAHELKTLA